MKVSAHFGGNGPTHLHRIHAHKTPFVFDDGSVKDLGGHICTLKEQITKFYGSVQPRNLACSGTRSHVEGLQVPIDTIASSRF